MTVQWRARLADLRQVHKQVVLDELLAHRSLALVGAGGKSTLLRQLCDLGAKGGRNVLATTTTKMFAAQLPQAYVGSDLDALAAHCAKSWSQGHCAFWAERFLPSSESRAKVAGPCLGLIDAYLGYAGTEPHSEYQVGYHAGHQAEAVGKAIELSCGAATKTASSRPDFFIYEADGARARRLKSPKAHEPVVAPWTEATILVLRLDCLGQRLSEELAYNVEAMGDIMDLSPGDVIRVDSLQRLILHKEGAFARTAGRPYIYFLYKEGQEAGLEALLQGLQEALDKGEDLAFRLGGQELESSIHVDEELGEVLDQNVDQKFGQHVGQNFDETINQNIDQTIDQTIYENVDIGALLLAAGQSQRLGRDKRQLCFQGQRLFFRACRSLRHCHPKFAVISGDRALAKVAEAEGFQVIWQDHPERGQGSSLSLGVKAFRQYLDDETRSTEELGAKAAADGHAVSAKADSIAEVAAASEASQAKSKQVESKQLKSKQVKGLLCFVGDQPLFNSGDVARLQGAFTRAYKRHGDRAIAMSAFGEEQRRGNPVIFGAHWWPRLETIVGDQGGRVICKQEGRQYVGCGTFTKEKGFDVDSVDDYGKLRQIEVAMKPLVLVRGGGDIASGCIYRLWRAGYPVIVNEIAIPTMVRREVCYGNAVHRGEMIVERLVSRYVSMDGVEKTLAEGVIPVLTDDYESIRQRFEPQIVVDAIIAKKNKGTKRDDAPLVIALGPGFTAGKDVDVVIETMRGHSLGRCIYDGEAIPNTGVPGEIDGHTYDRVLYAPCEGLFQAKRHIGELVAKGEIVAYVEDQPVKAQVGGVLRGLLKHGLMVPKGMKIGDVDSRCEEAHCFSISDKALAIAGGVMEAIEAWRVERGKDGRDV